MKPELFLRKDVLCAVLLLAGCSASGPRLIAGPGTAKPGTTSSFVREQLRFSRVRQARDASDESLERLFHDRKINYETGAEIYLRVFKLERELEVWVRSADDERFELLRSYPICALAGLPGPKRTEGDGQVPEGFYSIDLFNPNSEYHLSLRINYPNERDRAAAHSQKLGGNIFIHGGCRSDGCLAITDEAIRELYWLAVMARGNGQQQIPVHIFPARLDRSPREVRKLRRAYQTPAVVQFWETLKPAYDYFQKKKVLPRVDVDPEGQYLVAE